MSFLTEAIWSEPVSAARLFVVSVGTLSVAFTALWTLAWIQRRYISRIPIRIHVAGTRGKSTATRLIAAILRARGLTVYGKTTGSEPRLLLPDGSERPIRRFGTPSIREQAKLMTEAAKAGAEAVVVECMAIRPEMLWASETLFMRATTLVVTNARPDHFEEFGDDPLAIADAIKWLIPTGGQVIVEAEAATDDFRRQAQMQGATLSIVETAGLDPTLANRKLATAVAKLYGVDTHTSQAAMDSATSDPGHFSERTLTIDDKPIRFANAFTCNDVESLSLLWNRRTDLARAVVVLNARADRPMRTKHFLRFLTQQSPLPFLFIVGDSLAYVLALRAGFSKASVRRLRCVDAEALKEIARAVSPGGTIWGIGNYRGFGSQLTKILAETSSPC